MSGHPFYMDKALRIERVEGKMNYAKAKQLAQKMFGPTARLERGKTKENTWTWAILIRLHDDWQVAGNGNTFDQMLQNAVQRMTEAKKRIDAQPAVTLKGNEP